MMAGGVGLTARLIMRWCETAVGPTPDCLWLEPFTLSFPDDLWSRSCAAYRVSEEDLGRYADRNILLKL